ncbi:MAG: hypothetical protein AVDCRST_MAG53-1622 [uncultured Solirubrobacteraceae bacterium]|uniref:Uncharacterized protein n=1 Tax=uncultured Solirubrobacteraceae bacterium TaxID=1162706 RepID=A0A6J4SII0_9ACTN|nr:MAG: hypothetical protein AVDCRST_MAG53-1622 [uncultured Solirubrobacteraceae bacterium]
MPESNGLEVGDYFQRRDPERASKRLVADLGASATPSSCRRPPEPRGTISIVSSDPALAHFPSGKFCANAAWTVIASQPAALDQRSRAARPHDPRHTHRQTPPAHHARPTHKDRPTLHLHLPARPGATPSPKRSPASARSLPPAALPAIRNARPVALRPVPPGPTAPAIAAPTPTAPARHGNAVTALRDTSGRAIWTVRFRLGPTGCCACASRSRSGRPAFTAFTSTRPATAPRHSRAPAAISTSPARRTAPRRRHAAAAGPGRRHRQHELRDGRTDAGGAAGPKRRRQRADHPRRP